MRPFRVVGVVCCCFAAWALATGHKHPKTKRSAQSDAGYHTSGVQMLDSDNRVVHFYGITWYGFETKLFVQHGLWAQDYKYLLDAVKANGFNMIRLPFSNEMVESNPVPTALAFSNATGPINTDLKGLPALSIMDKVIDYADKLGLYIVLDNHRSEAGDSAESSGLWYIDQYPESSWLKDWATIADRYRNVRNIVGADLRNEPHNAKIGGACWTGDPASFTPGCPESDTARNWPVAAQTLAAQLLKSNPRWLMFVEGVDRYGEDWYWNGGNLEGVRKHPIVLPVPNKLVYSPHEYGRLLYPQPWFGPNTTVPGLTAIWQQHWGYIEDDHIAPLWIGEFGTHNLPRFVQSDQPGSQGQWFSGLIDYLKQHRDVSWSYWSLNGDDQDGLLDKNFTARPVLPEKQAKLASIQGDAAR